jgi:hypothetical protein
MPDPNAIRKDGRLFNHPHRLPVIAQLLAAFETHDIVPWARIHGLPIRTYGSLRRGRKWLGELSVTAGDR